MSRFSEIIKELIAGGADPNDLLEEFENTVKETQEWAIWGDGRWRREMVCSRCGSPYAGICSDGHVKIGDSKNPALHRNQPGVSCIPLKEWLLKKKSGRT